MGRCACWTRQRWNRCAREAPEMFAAPSTVFSSCRFQVGSGRVTADVRWLLPVFILMLDLFYASADKGQWSKNDRSVPSGTRQTKKARLTKTKQPNEEAAIGCKDTSLFLFRALGKILHCKRELFKSLSLLFGPTLANNPGVDCWFCALSRMKGSCMSPIKPHVFPAESPALGARAEY